MEKIQSTTKNNRLETTFLKELIASETFVSVFLRNGLQLKGVIVENQQNALLLNNNGNQQLIFKHIVSTIYPHPKKET